MPQQHLRPVSTIDPREWEAMCHRCGLCCQEKVVEKDGTIVVLDTACRFLDVATRTCRIYEHRFEACSDCLPVTEDNLAEMTWLPDNCAYVEFMTQVHGSDQWRQKARVIWPDEEDW